MGKSTRKARIDFLTLFIVTISIGSVLAVLSPDLTSSGPTRPSPTISAPPSGQYFDHVIIIVMENEGVFDICRQSPPPCLTSGPAPYMAGLANNYTIGAQYLALISTSQPNYVALFSGSMQGCTANGCPSPITAPNLVDRIEASGLTWKGYMENQTARGCDFSSPEPYASIHNPFIVFQDITNNTARCNKIVDANPFSCGTVVDCNLVNDLNNATSPAPSFMWLTPNDCDNMRGNSVCNNPNLIASGNTYLSKLVPTILNSRTFTTTRSALFITFDEGNSFCPFNGSSENCVYASWSGPQAKTSFGSNNLYNHYSFTKTIDTNWGFTPLATGDQNANPMAEFFKAQAPDFSLAASPAVLNTPTNVRINSTITVSSLNSFNGTVALTATSNPTGPTLTLTPASVTITKGHSSTSTLSFTSSTVGTFMVLVKGTSGTLSHNTTLTVTVGAPDFTISANPSSLTIGQLSSIAGNPVVVNSTGSRTFFESSYLQQSFSAQGLIWLFYEDSRFNCEHLGGCLTYTTSTNGTKWAFPTRTSVHITDSDFSVATNGTSVFYARYNESSYDSNCGRKLYFGLGNLNPTGSITWQPEQTVFQGATNRAYADDEITIDSTGRAWIAYMIDNKSSCGGTGTERPAIIHSTGTNYVLWTGNMTLCLSACHSLNEHIALTSLGNGEVYSLYWVSKFGLHGRLFNGTAWGSEETISTDPTDVNNWAFNAGTNVYAIYFDNTTETYNFATRSTTGTWTTNPIGAAETRAGPGVFNPAYYSLPDAASYDSKDNLFDLFYMNSTTQTIDQWSGFSLNWTKTTGLVSTGPVPYSDSISSFIQSSPTLIGSIFFISGSGPTFTMNSASLSFIEAGDTGATKITIASKNGFSGTVNLTTTINPSTGLTIICSPTSITGGSGSSSCTLTSTAAGNYNVTVTGTNNTLTHSVLIAVRSLAVPDFTISVTTPPATDVNRPVNATITLTSLNHFTSTVSLTRTVAAGLTCGAITPATLPGSGNATISCSSAIAGTYQVNVTGTSGPLSHSVSFNFKVEDFSLTESTSMISSQIGTNPTATITVTSLNGYAGNLNLTAIVDAGAIIGTGGSGGGLIIAMTPPPSTPQATLTPASVTLASGGSGQSTLTIVISFAVQAGVYPVSISAGDGTLIHNIQLTLFATDFTLATNTTSLTLAMGGSSNQILTLNSVNGFKANITMSAAFQPTGPTATITPSTVSLTSISQCNLTITVPLATLPGNYNLTIQATSETLVHTVTIIVTVTPALTTVLARIVTNNTPATIGLLGTFGAIILATSRRSTVNTKRSRQKQRKIARETQIYEYRWNPVPNYPVAVNSIQAPKYPDD